MEGAGESGTVTRPQEGQPRSRGFISRRGKSFFPFYKAFGPPAELAQLSGQWMTKAFPQGKSGSGVKFSTHLHSFQRVHSYTNRMYGHAFVKMSNQRTWEFISKIKFGNNMDEMFQMTLLGILGVTAETGLR